ncbi:MAG: hypothetical protein JO000_31155 [Alphaproteobacteria bacterium]|nr:hypothetical protein [Alphaproteobacteria bacterium]
MSRPPTKSEKPRPPDVDPFVRVWRVMGRCYLGVGIGILIFGCALLVFAMLEKNPSSFSQIVKIAGGLIAVTSLQLFNMGRKRFERIGAIETLRRRWIDLAEGGGSATQLAELDRIFTKVLKDNLAGAL